jgi:uncharacterized protein YegJ (DUF2314 family)
MRAIALAFLLALALAPAAAWAQKGEQGASSSSDMVLGYENSDARMNAAIEAARASLPMFLQEFATARADQRGAFSVKVGLATPEGGREHIWVNNLRYEGDDLVGDIANYPYYLPNLVLGSRIVIAVEDISDWTFESPQGLYGAYTTRVMVEDMAPQEQGAYRAMLAPTPIPPHWQS